MPRGLWACKNPLDVSKLSELEDRLRSVRDRIRAGFPQRAGELRDAAGRLENGDEDARDQIRRFAHRLRGIAGSADQAALGERAGRLEEAAKNEAISALAILEGARRLAHRIDKAIRPPGSPMTAPPPKREVVKPTALGWRVVALDDSSDTRRLLEITLRTAGGCDAHVFAEPGEAMRAVVAETPDLVIVDAMMPEMDGLTFYRGVRERAGANVPVVILSAASPEELGWTLPVDERLRWMRKPFRPASLLGELRAFVDA